MSWFSDLFVVFLVGLINILMALFLGLYWLKHERYPWESKD